ncbi:hypothetical protein Taro_006790, partial [Colocasia esculenta]|nr:hypothetical protein [Colocasia esculenta]
MDTLACSDPAAHSGNNPSPAGSALLLTAPTAPLAAAPTDVTAATACTDAYPHERTTSSTSKSGQHRLSPKKKKRKRSLNYPKGAGALELMDPTLCPVWITVARKSPRPKTKKPLQKHCTVLGVLLRTLEHHSPPLLYDGRWGLGRKPLLLLLSLPQRNALQQRVPRLLELLGLGVDRHVLGCNRPVRLELLTLHQLMNLPAS